MSTKLIKSLLLAASVGFLLLWVLEAYRTDLQSSYWLAMLSLVSLLSYQYYRLRSSPGAAPPPAKPEPPRKRPRKVRKK